MNSRYTNMKWKFRASSTKDESPSLESLFKRAALIGQGPIESRAEIERQVKSDLEKPYEQLLADAHQELLHWDWAALERIIHSHEENCFLTGPNRNECARATRCHSGING